MSTRVYVGAWGGEMEIVFNAMLDENAHENVETFVHNVDKVSDETLAELRATSPRGRSTRKPYWRGWRKTSSRLDKGLGGIFVVIDNKNKPTLTHLLENGHDVVRGGPKILGGVTIGKARAFPHIEKARKNAVRKLTKGV